jgi:hypothetical protein
LRYIILIGTAGKRVGLSGERFQNESSTFQGIENWKVILRSAREQRSAIASDELRQKTQSAAKNGRLELSTGRNI